MDIKVKLKNKNIIVSELTDDLYVDNIVLMYDDESPYMFCKVKSVDSSITDIEVGDILVVRRYAKEEFISNLYFVAEQDVRCIIKEEEYERLIS
jgi:hypothetical protein